MRNLKKLLALVLAMVMAFSLMLTASAIDYEDYPDKDSITAEFDEGVKVLTGLEVFQGDEKGFRPSDKITRAEAAAVIYRAVTGDVTDRQSDLYKDYSTFVDVKSDDWFAGYVGYCQNAGYIKGTSPTTFQPYGQVTGYEVLAMILRAVGYGKNNEFVGSSWQVNVAALAKQLGVTRNVVAAHMDQTLNMAAPREVVADLIFMTIATVPTVTYTPSLSYQDRQSVIAGVATPFNPTLGQKVFGLFYSTNWELVDEWGRPGYYWWKGGVWQTNATVTNVANGKAYMTPIGHPLYRKLVGAAAPGGQGDYTATGWINAFEGWNFVDVSNAAIAWREENLVATIVMEPTYATNEQVRECDVAHELGIAVEDTFRLFVNGVNGWDGRTPETNNNYRVVASDTVTKVGGQGRQTEFYYEIVNPWFQQDQTDNYTVMIDTMLAQVTAKNDAKLDKNNHVIVPAQLEVTIWDGNEAGANAVPTTASKRIIQKQANDATNWEDYKKGDYILINAWTNKALRNTDAERDSAAFETDKVIDRDNVIPYTDNILTIDESVWIVDNGKKGIAENFTGKQTTIYYNQNKHNVNDKDYNDQLCLFMDRAGTNLNTTYTWYLDQFGNLIGIGDAQSSRFGVITSVYAAISTDDTDTTGGVKAVASVRYTDGTTGTVTVDSFLMSSKAAVALASTGATGNNALTAEPNTQLTAAANTIELIPVYDEAGHGAMSVGPITSNVVGASSDAQWNAWLYMAPSAATNLNNHFGIAGSQFDAYGILFDHMFEFTTASDNSVVAVEVAGEWQTNDSTNTGIYVDKANGESSNTATVTSANDALGRVYKNLGYMALNYTQDVNGVGGGDTGTTTAGARADAYLDNNTQILVRTAANGRTLTAYTLETLPSDITLFAASDADWADVDGDGRIDYLYVSGSVSGTVTYNLFYYNGGAAKWDSTGGTIEGYLNGDAATITFPASGRAMFDAISNSVNGYDGHLFAVRINNDVVNAVLFADGLNTNAFAQSTREILKHWDAASNSFQNLTGWILGSFNANLNTASNGTGDAFAVGSSGGNKYTANTEAVYWRDNAFADGTPDGSGVNRHTNASYVRVSNGYQIQVTGHQPDNTYVNETYWISPSAKIIGELEWLNQYECDVTIVYENTASNAATQVYITPDPDVTPVNPDQGNVLGTRPNGTIVVGSATNGTEAVLANAVNNGAPNTIVWGSPVPATAGTIAPFNALQAGFPDISTSGSTLGDWMFFPFNAADGTNVNLRITRADTGVEVFAARATFGAGSLKVFGVNFRNTANNAGAPLRLSLWSGWNYNFEITTTTATPVVLSSGTFTMI